MFCVIREMEWNNEMNVMVCILFVYQFFVLRYWDEKLNKY